ncbi:MAG: Arc family DNA binding domain-containing protein [Bacteroidales bacterium]|nr:Arc family DNA binding domain-containing protein [Bacteroidales bacterium]MBK9358655.1 Arc family DNA binding domain-containing protein [Bacteroidales bacterium]
MAQKKSFALRIDAEILEAVEKWAADEFRSTNGQLEWIISRALKEAKRMKDKPRDVSTLPPEV